MVNIFSNTKIHSNLGVALCCDNQLRTHFAKYFFSSFWREVLRNIKAKTVLHILYVRVIEVYCFTDTFFIYIYIWGIYQIKINKYPDKFLLAIILWFINKKINNNVVVVQHCKHIVSRQWNHCCFVKIFLLTILLF